MKTLIMISIVSFAMLAPLAASQDDCRITSADPATINQVDVPVTGQTFYIEERDVVVDCDGDPFTLLCDRPIPGSGFLLGNGTFIYEETNGITVFNNPDQPGWGLQRGGVGLLGDWFPPGCDQTPLEQGDLVWQEDGRPVTDVSSYHVDPSGTVAVPCLLIDEDPINDETCGAGPDTLILSLNTA